jgi:hypothetical protein
VSARNNDVECEIVRVEHEEVLVVKLLVTVKCQDVRQLLVCEEALSTKLVAMTIMLEDMMGTKLMSMIKLIDRFEN